MLRDEDLGQLLGLLVRVYQRPRNVRIDPRNELCERWWGDISFMKIIVSMSVLTVKSVTVRNEKLPSHGGDQFGTSDSFQWFEE